MRGTPCIPRLIPKFPLLYLQTLSFTFSKSDSPSSTFTKHERILLHLCLSSLYPTLLRVFFFPFISKRSSPSLFKFHSLFFFVLSSFLIPFSSIYCPLLSSEREEQSSLSLDRRHIWRNWFLLSLKRGATRIILG